MERDERAFAAAYGADRVLVREIGGIIDETGKMHTMMLRQMREQRMRTDFIALIGRVRKAMTKKKDFQTHASPVHACAIG